MEIPALGPQQQLSEYSHLINGFLERKINLVITEVNQGLLCSLIYPPNLSNEANISE